MDVGEVISTGEIGESFWLSVVAKAELAGLMWRADQCGGKAQSMGDGFRYSYRESGGSPETSRHAGY
jgi:hypothetical protein